MTKRKPKVPIGTEALQALAATFRTASAALQGYSAIEAMPTPCAECPWRKDVAPGRFPPGRFRALAETAYDAAFKVFQCHKTTDERPIACAGAILANSEHNLTIRMARSAGLEVEPCEAELFPSYREMAIANGVAADDPVLALVRGDRDP